VIKRHPNVVVHGFDNTHVATEFIVELAKRGGVPKRWNWHRVLLASRDDETTLTMALPRSHKDAFVPVTIDAAGADGKRKEARPKMLTDEVRSIHWFPYDRVGVVNADP
jgi:hypothetical protein